MDFRPLTTIRSGREMCHVAHGAFPVVSFGLANGKEVAVPGAVPHPLAEAVVASRGPVSQPEPGMMVTPNVRLTRPLGEGGMRLFDWYNSGDTEFVVPRSMPTARAMLVPPVSSGSLPAPAGYVVEPNTLKSKS